MKKDGTVLAYKCKYCNYQSFNLNQTKNHMNKCLRFIEIQQQMQLNEIARI